VKVVWSETALGQLDEIFAYIARDNPAAATKVASRIRATADLLATTPRIGRTTDRPGIFVLTMARYPYVIFYRLIPRKGQVRVIRIRHTSRRS
jgi:toxin ParE1/3/4